jgi:drug/metabolite transporter (DMT)-like permease
LAYLRGTSGPVNRRNKYIAIVLLSALLVGYEAVAVEIALKAAFIDIFLVASMPAIVGGIILIAFTPRKTAALMKEFTRKEWIFFLLLSAVATFGVLLWYDAVELIGASKEAILGGGSSEVLFVVILSAIFLGERLNRWEIFGSFLVLMGVFLVLVNKDVLSLSVGRGEIEAIVSSFFLGTSVIMVAKMLRNHPVIPFSGLELLISGIILLIVAVIIAPIEWPDATGWFLLIVLGIFPALAISAYYAGLQGIGASITSVLFALTGMLTVVAQLTLVFFVPPDTLQFPENITLALLGGMIAFIGVYLIERNPSEEKTRIEQLEYPH